MGWLKDTIDSAIKGVLKTVLYPIRPIIEPLIALGGMMEPLLHVILKFVSIIPKLLQLFLEFTNPIKLIKNIVEAVKISLYLLWSCTIGFVFQQIVQLFIGKEGTSKVNETIKKSLLDIFLLVISPPIAIIVSSNNVNILEVIICSILTYFYYIPGLIYSCLIIL